MFGCVVHMIYPRPPAIWLVFAFELTGDDRYRVPLRELILAFPDMVKSWAAFDKWIPIQLAGVHAALPGSNHGAVNGRD